MYRTITVYGRPFHTFPLCFTESISVIRADPLSLAATDGISKLISFHAGTKMFQFPAFASITYEFSYR